MSEAALTLDVSSMPKVAAELRAMAMRIGANRKYDNLNRVQDALTLAEIADAIEDQFEARRPLTCREVEAARVRRAVRWPAIIAGTVAVVSGCALLVVFLGAAGVVLL